jgi:hypothetical protein
MVDEAYAGPARREASKVGGDDVFTGARNTNVAEQQY